jgi:parallel beta-helix repeat protein
MNDPAGAWATRLMQSIPTSYTIWKDGSTYRAESNIAGGTDYSGTDGDSIAQNALTAIHGAGGGKFLLRANTTVEVDANLLVGTNTIIEGEDPASSIIKAIGALASQILINKDGSTATPPFGTANNNIVLRNIKLDGNGLVDRCAWMKSNYFKMENCILQGSTGYGVKNVYSDHIWHLNNQVLGGGTIIDGLDTLYCTDVHVSENYVYNCTGDGIAFVHGDYGILTNNYVDMNDQANSQGITVWDGTYALVANNIVLNTAINAIPIIEYETVASDFVEIANNYLQDSAQDGIFIRGYATTPDFATHINVHDNIIQNTGRYAVCLLRAKYCKVHGNNIIATSQLANGTYDAIRLDYDSINANTYNSFANNTIVEVEANKPKYGINNVNAANNYTLALGNVITGPVTANLNILGANSVSEHNVG